MWVRLWLGVVSGTCLGACVCSAWVGGSRVSAYGKRFHIALWAPIHRRLDPMSKIALSPVCPLGDL